MKRLNAIRKEWQNALRVGVFLAFRQLRRSSRGATGLIIFIMVLTFLNLVVVSGLLLGLITGSFDQFRDHYSGEVIVTTLPGRDYIENSPTLISFLRQHEMVLDYSPRYIANVQVLGTLNDLPGKNERANTAGAQLTGIDPTREERMTKLSEYIIAGEMLDAESQGEIVMGANTIREYSAFADVDIPGFNPLTAVDVGSRVRVTLTTDGGTVVKKDFIVKGVLKSKVDQVSNRMFVPESDLRSMLQVNQSQYQEIAIHTTLEYAPILSREIKDFMGPNSGRIQTSSEAIPTFLRDIETTMGVLGNALSSIALVVASITIFIVIFINAITKRKFIGIMKGIGISPKAIEVSYIIQALFYGTVGSLIGLILTFGFLKPYFLAYPINFPFSDGILVATPEGAAIRVFILLAVTLAAGFIPARMIVRKNTLDAILGR